MLRNNVVRSIPARHALLRSIQTGKNPIIYLYTRILPAVATCGGRRYFSPGLQARQPQPNQHLQPKQTQDGVKYTSIETKPTLAHNQSENRDIDTHERVKVDNSAIQSLTPANITKKYLLSQATNLFSKILIHLKWPLKRNNKPFSLDDLSAFASWVVMGNLLWIILGTTTFVLSGMYILHLVNGVSDYFDTEKNEEENGVIDTSFGSRIASGILSHGLGLRVEFRKGNLLPQLHDGMLRFKNVHILSKKPMEGEIDFKAQVEHLDVSLSFGKWYDGKGLIDELEIFGMNAKIYKNESKHKLLTLEADKELPLSIRSTNHVNSIHQNTFERYNIHRDLGVHEEDEDDFVMDAKLADPDYEISHCKIHDSYFEIYSNGINETQSIPPMKVTIFNCDLPELRGNRLLIDFFNANNVTGAINDSMFTIHKHQKFNDNNSSTKMVRFKLDGIDMGKISRRNQALKFNWIMNGRAEIIADIMLPQPSTDNQFDLSKEYKKLTYMFSDVLNEMISQDDSVATTNPDLLTIGPKGDPTTPSLKNDDKLLKSALAAVYDTFSLERENIQRHHNNKKDNEYVIVNFKIKLYDLSASLPQQLPTASSTNTPFLSLHNLRLLIAFVNNHFDSDKKPPLVIKTTVIEKFSNLYNTSNLSETNILDFIVSDIYEDLMRMVAVDEKRLIQQRQNMWSHTIASQLLLIGLGVLA